VFEVNTGKNLTEFDRRCVVCWK